MLPFMGPAAVGAAVVVEYLIVGAGGAGDGRSYSTTTRKGGLGGQVLQGSLVLTAGQSLAVTVGQPVAGAAGQSSTFGSLTATGGAFAGQTGAGVNGVTSSISGTAKVYGSNGGAGKFYDAGSGAGTGEPGGTNAGNGGDGSSGPTTAGAAPGGDATANLGGGGGGNSTYRSADSLVFGESLGGAGASGVIVARYLGPQRATGGTVTSAGGYTIHTFTVTPGVPFQITG